MATTVGGASVARAGDLPLVACVVQPRTDQRVVLKKYQKSVRFSCTGTYLLLEAPLLFGTGRIFA